MIEVKNLTKYYGTYKAVDNISFSVTDGEIVGFLGPNGAGKTTTMNIMTGYISSTDGTVFINEFDVLENPEEAKKHIGYLPDVPPLYGDMTVTEFLKFVCDIKKVQKKLRPDMLSDIMKTVKIDNIKDRIIKNLSKGYRQRVGLAQALIGYPDVLILDEPTIGLDPKQIIEMRDVIKQLGEKHTVILSSHILSEVSAVCDRIIIINDGKIIDDRTTEEFSNKSPNGKILVELKCSKELAFEIFNEDFLEISDEKSKDKETSLISISLKYNPEQQFDLREYVFNKAVKENIPILLMKSMELTLEDIFLKAINNSFDDDKSLDDDINKADNIEENNIENIGISKENIDDNEISGGE